MTVTELRNQLNHLIDQGCGQAIVQVEVSLDEQAYDNTEWREVNECIADAKTAMLYND